MAECLKQFEQWGVSRQYADGALPAPGVYGVPAQWPHVRAVYERGRIRAGGPHRDRLAWRVSPIFAVRLSHRSPACDRAFRRDSTAPASRPSWTARPWPHRVEILEQPSRLPSHGGFRPTSATSTWSRSISAVVSPPGLSAGRRAAAPPRRGRARARLRVARERDECIAFLAAVGFRELTRTQRG